ncbi:hypothetical protein [Sulfuricurvum sp.]|uniref:hypothetical protein n=1 Tax=Sulfuricurvum sp. TaxID=2025608 RepID=UPI003BAF3B8B
MRGLLLSTLTAVYLFGAAEEGGNILSEVAKLRQKYEECRAGQNTVLGIDPKLHTQCEKDRDESKGKVRGYASRIASLEGLVQQNTKELSRLKKRNTEIERELSQKKGIIQSLEKTVNTRDKKYREEAARNEILTAQSNTAKVSRIERQSLTNALTKAKFEVERLEQLVSKTTKERTRLEKELTEARAQADKYRNVRPVSVPNVQEVKTVAVSSDQSGKVKALQDELAKANVLIVQLQNNASKALPKEKIVTKIVEPTDKIVALQRELSAAQTTIANLKNNSSKTIVKEKIVEKVVYKDRPVVQEKIVTRVVEPTEKINALQRELSAAQATIANLKNSSSKTILKEKIVEKVVYKERPVEKIVEKVVYKDRPVVQEKIVTKIVEPTEKLKALQDKLAQSEAQIAKLKAQPQKLTVPKAPKSAPQNDIAQTNLKKSSAVAVLKAPAVSAPAVKKGTSSAYRMAANAPIYNAPGGHQVDTWEERRSFTAGNPSNGWVHITGYFVNRVWQSTAEGENLWVKESDVIRR